MYQETLPVLGDWEFYLRFLEKFDIGVIDKPLAFYHHRPQMSGAYGNTLYSGFSQHVRYDAVIRNELLRRDIQRGQFGLGFLINVGRDNASFQITMILEKLIRIAKKLRIKWLIDRLAR